MLKVKDEESTLASNVDVIMLMLSADYSSLPSFQIADGFCKCLNKLNIDAIIVSI